MKVEIVLSSPRKETAIAQISRRVDRGHYAEATPTSFAEIGAESIILN
ncbi:hypothetical protein H6F98_12260 [Microcoleus sp. FACHB-SPT15]|nr:hypothetical protein [Microcoleus sp. FACHB-SPT15]MBD1806220.1 hypothetical protein [Microcoleus sp. FACHB-SPT15]